MLGEVFEVGDLVTVCSPEEVAAQLGTQVKWYPDGHMERLYAYDEWRALLAGKSAVIVSREKAYSRASCPPGGSEYRYLLNIENPGRYFRDYQLIYCPNEPDDPQAWAQLIKESE